jgi:hypothetical protein
MEDLVFVTGRRRYNRSVDGRVLGLCLALAACSRDGARPAPPRSASDSYLLRVRVSGNGEVSVGRLGDRCADDCTYHVLRGKTVQLTAVGKEDVFHTWSDPCASDASCAITMASNVSIRAEFGLDRYQLAWAVPLTTTACAEVSGISVGDRVVIAAELSGSAAFGRATLSTDGRRKAFVAALEPSDGGFAWATALDDDSFAPLDAVRVLRSGEIVAAETVTGPASPGVGDKLVASRRPRPRVRFSCGSTERPVCSSRGAGSTGTSFAA